MKIKLNTIINPTHSDFETLCKRPAGNPQELFPLVSEVFEKVKAEGDKALDFYTQKFDKTKILNLEVSKEEFSTSSANLNKNLKKAIKTASKNIEKFHKFYFKGKKSIKIETTKGVKCWAKCNAIEKVGLYIPGGTAPLFSSVLMLAIPAKIAGCREVIICTPPDESGNIHPAILYCASICGVSKVFKVGGIQAIAAMAIGTETIPKTYKIFGPGNAYVNAAKAYSQLLGTAIDLPAGPSEVAVYAGVDAHPEFAASDLIAQAEHGSDSQVILIAHSQDFVSQVEQAINNQLEQNPRKNFATDSLKNSKAIIVKNENLAFDFINAYAPEHLIILDNNAEKLCNKVYNAGSVFVGHWSSESVGDYASGTNHTLPTAGTAKAYSGVSIDSFLKRITYQKISKTGLNNLGNEIITMANVEGLYGHANSIKLRMKD